MRKVTSIILSLCIFLSGIASVVYANDAVVNEPVFSHEGGIYKENFMLAVDGGGNTVYYTLDGSIPNEKSTVYNSPIVIDPMNVSPRSIQGRVAQQRWEKGIVVRAIAVDAFGNASKVVSNTYFVSERIANLNEDIPVVALSASPYDFWDAKEGIYTNYDNEHNITGYVEFFDNNGEGFERSIEMKVSGHGSRGNPKKSIRLYFTKGDTEGRKNVEYNLIESADKNFYNADDVKKHGKITFRISDWAETDLKDPMAQRITSYMRPDTAASDPAALFLNGEFWGIYETREQYDNRYLDYHYEDIGKDDVIFLDRDWTTENEEYVLSDNGYTGVDRILYEEGPEEDEAYYRDQFNYVKYLMLNAKDKDVYEELKACVDIDNLIDYLFVYFYTDNIDWPGNNLKFWRTSVERSNGDVYAADGKWRFMVHDFDLAFDGMKNNTMEYALKSTLPPTEPRHPQFAAEIFEGMFQNEEFRNRFAQRAMAYLSTAVSEENVENMISDMVSTREAVKGYDLMRWNNQSGTLKNRVESWKNNAYNKFVNFAKTRNGYFKEMLVDFYKKYYESSIAPGAKFVFEIDQTKASCDIDGAVIRESFYNDKASAFTTEQFADVALNITAECKDGYIVKSICVEKDGQTTTFDASYVTIVPEAGEYKVKFEIVEGNEEEIAPDKIKLVREERFTKMTVGEKLPIEVIAYKNGKSEKVFGFEVVSDSDIVQIGENGVITAMASGSARLTVKYSNCVCEANVIIK